MADDYSTRLAAREGDSPSGSGAGPTLRARIAWFLVAACACALFARLGLWQLDRAHQKIAAAELIEQRVRLPVLPAAALARDAGEGPTQWQRRVALEGHWVVARTVWLADRTMDGRAGFYVLTPLEIGQGDAVMVQRGWAPRDWSDPSRLPPLATPAGAVQVGGRVAPWPSHWLELGPARVGSAGSGAIRQNLDRASLAAETGLTLRPVTVVEDEEGGAPPDGLLRHWNPPAVDVDRHYGYAAQWFAMGATCLALYGWLMVVKPRRRRQETEPAAHAPRA